MLRALVLLRASDDLAARRSCVELLEARGAVLWSELRIGRAIPQPPAGVRVVCVPCLLVLGDTLEAAVRAYGALLARGLEVWSAAEGLEDRSELLVHLLGQVDQAREAERLRRTARARAAGRGGRGRLPVTAADVVRGLGRGRTMAEIARHHGCSIRTLQRRRQEAP